MNWNWNFKNSLEINFDIVKDMISGQKEDNVTVIDNYKICRDKGHNALLSLVDWKEYRIVFNKRVIKENFETIPNGM